jgi:hypothetical protein
MSLKTEYGKPVWISRMDDTSTRLANTVRVCAISRLGTELAEGAY